MVYDYFIKIKQIKINMEKNIIQIYESVIGEMKNEIIQLKLNLKHQNLLKKLEKRRAKINSLINYISNKQNELQLKAYSPLKFKLISSFDSPSIDSIYTSLKSQINSLSQKIFREKFRKSKEYNYYEKILKFSNSNLYVLIMRLNETSRINRSLKSNLVNIENYRKELINHYSKITQILKKVLAQSEKQERIDVLESLIREKVQKINWLEDSIQKYRKTFNPDPKVSRIFAKYREFENYLKEIFVQREKLNVQLKIIDEEVDFSMKNPEDIPLVTANRNMRGEIKRLDNEICSRSKYLKELEREKLAEQLKYSDLLKKKSEMNVNLKPMKKSLSSCNTHSSIFIDRSSGNNDTRQNYSRNTERKSKRASMDVVSMISSNNNFLNKNVLIALDSFAPGKRITEKIIAFNRSFNFSSP